MRRLAPALVALAVALCLAPSAQAQFGLADFDVTFTDWEGAPVTQAGSHPYSMKTSFDVATEEVKEKELPAAPIKNFYVAQVPGFIGDQTAVHRCETVDFLDLAPGGLRVPECADSSAVGLGAVRIGQAVSEPITSPLYFLVPSPGTVAKLGFWVEGVVVTIDIDVSPDPPYRLLATTTNVSQALEFFGAELTLWGVPADPRHDKERGACFNGKKSCPAGAAETSFLTMPRACEGPLATNYELDSWPDPGVFVKGSVFTHDDAIPPNPQGFSGCGVLPFAPAIDAKPTSRAASSPSGLDFSIQVDDEGLKNPSGRAGADIAKTVVTLPPGLTANPALAAGLAVCTEAQFEAESPYLKPGEGPTYTPPDRRCPEASKIGSVELETPILGDRILRGSLYIAKPYENPFGSLLAIYMVIRDAELGLIIRQPLEVVPDPVTGRLTTIAEDLPPYPISRFALHFREGARSPLATPAACGTYDGAEIAPGVFNPDPIKATLYPSSGGVPLEASSSFEIISGPNNGPCPSGGLPPFHPDLVAGTTNNAAGSFSPFVLSLSRTDSEQEITHFSIKLPPGITGKLAGIPYCSDAAIEAAKARTGPHGGQEELDDPSCPAASQVGNTLAGAGVGPNPAYAPGKVYLAGPYNGSNLSMVAITAGVVGPFDLGTVVVREGFKIDPETAEVFIDATGSDPIPHIIRGIPVHLRDIRAYVDRPNFTLNPTDCTPTSTASTVLGSGLDFVSEADDNPITVTSPFQAADCAALDFKPRLSLKLLGGTKRGAHPRFKAHLRMGGIGEAGIARARVTLPRSEFIENAHFRTICTRVQFKAGGGNGEQCPPGSIYGHAKAITPILDEPLTGPVFLRSSEHPLPDLVVALHNSQVDFNLIGRIDSVRGGGLRNTFEAAPDAPVSSFDLVMAGGKKGLFVNSTDLCRRTYRARAVFHGQNGKRRAYKPKMRAVKCAKQRKRRRARHARAVRAARAALAGSRAAG